MCQRKKSLLKKDSLKKSHKLTCKVIKMLTDKFWEEGISFYIDAAGFQHKYNPHREGWFIRTMTWVLLKDHCSVRGSHKGLGGRVAHFIVAISHQKGVVLCEQCEGITKGDVLRLHQNPNSRNFQSMQYSKRQKIFSR